MFAVRSVSRGGMYRADFERLVANNGGRKIPALVALTRQAIRLMYSVAVDRRLTRRSGRGRIAIVRTGRRVALPPAVRKCTRRKPGSVRQLMDRGDTSSRPPPNAAIAHPGPGARSSLQ